MSKLAERIERMDESATLRMAKLSRELKAKGVDIIDLSLGEPDFDTPEHIRESAIKAIETGYSHYTPVSGYLDVREAISKKFADENNLHFQPDQIVVSTGAKQSIMNIVLCLVNPGDEVILPAPYWVSYKAMVQMAEGVCVVVPTTIERDFKLSPEQLEAAITPKTKLLIFSSPCNPTGTVYSSDELKALADVIAAHESVYVISDEIYEKINFMRSHASIASFENIKDRVMVVNGLSKGYAMTGWRLGYMGGPAFIAKACDKIQGQFTSATNSIGQRSIIAALQGTQQPSEAMKDAFLKRRNLCLSYLKNIDGLKYNIPQGAFYFFPDVSNYFGKSHNGKTIHNADDLCMYLLDEAHVSLVTGSAFGDDNCIRISYATSEENLEKAMQRITKALAQLS